MAYEGPPLLIIEWASDESHECIWHTHLVCVEVDNCCRAMLRDHIGLLCCQEEPEVCDPF